MRILSRYVLVRFLSWFAATIVVLAVGLTIAEMLLHLDDLAEDAEGMFGAIRFLVLRVCSYYLPILIPIASFTATYLSVGLSARWLEITAAKAGGISPLRLTVPVLVAAGVLSGATLLVNETVVLKADRTWRAHLAGEDEEIEFRRGSFWYATGNYIYNVGDADPQAQTLHELRVFEMSPEGRLVRRIYASLAQVREGDLHLFDATELRFPSDQPNGPPARTWRQQIKLDTDSGSNPTLLKADPATLSLASLREFIEQRSEVGGDPTRSIALFHGRLSDPLSVFLLALLAIPFALRVEQTKSLAVPALQGVGLLLVFWTLRNGGALLASSGAGAAAATPWVILFAFMALGGWRLARVPS